MSTSNSGLEFRSNDCPTIHEFPNIASSPEPLVSSGNISIFKEFLAVYAASGKIILSGRFINFSKSNSYFCLYRFQPPRMLNCGIMLDRALHIIPAVTVSWQRQGMLATFSAASFLQTVNSYSIAYPASLMCIHRSKVRSFRCQRWQQPNMCLSCWNRGSVGHLCE